MIMPNERLSIFAFFIADRSEVTYHFYRIKNHLRRKYKRVMQSIFIMFSVIFSNNQEQLNQRKMAVRAKCTVRMYSLLICASDW